MPNRRGNLWIVCTWLAATTPLAVACTTSSSTSPGEAADSGAPDTLASNPAFDASDAVPSGGDAADSAAPDTLAPNPTLDASDAATCPSLPQGEATPDKEVTSLCASIASGHFSDYWGVSTGTKACGGLLAVYERHGVDSGDFWFFDATSLALVEAMSGADFNFTCTGSVNGVDLATSQAASCFGNFDAVNASGSGWAFQLSCSNASDGGPDGSPDAPAE